MDDPSENATVRLPDDSEGQQFVLYPIFESHDHRTFELARDVAEGAGATLLVLDLSGEDDEIVDESRRVGSDLLKNRLDDRHDVEVVMRFERTSDPAHEVITVARNYETRLIVFDEHTPESLASGLTGDVTDRISDRVPCDVVTVERTKGRRIASILVPIAGGPHSGLAASIGGAIARSTDAVVELFHVSEPEETDAQIADRFDEVRDRLPSDIEVETWRLDRASAADAIIEQSNHYDVTVLGEPQKGHLQQFVFGSVTDSVSRDALNTVLVSRRSNGEPFSL